MVDRHSIIRSEVNCRKPVTLTMPSGALRETPPTELERYRDVRQSTKFSMARLFLVATSGDALNSFCSGSKSLAARQIKELEIAN